MSARTVNVSYRRTHIIDKYYWRELKMFGCYGRKTTTKDETISSFFHCT